MRHKKLILSLVLSLFTVLILVSCGSQSNVVDTEGMTSVTFKINSGNAGGDTLTDAKYANSSKDVVYYYNLKGGKKTLIYCILDESLQNDKEYANVNVFNKINSLSDPAGYVLEGWYTSLDYTNKFDFENDYLEDGKSLVLYPKWESRNKLYYDLGYTYNGEFITLESYQVEKNTKFSDDFNSAENSKKVTWLGHYYIDQELKTELTDENNPYPTANNTRVKIYIDYIEGQYKLVSNYKELTSAIGSNIYLTSNIDCEGKDLSFGDYANKIFKGNGYTISNFNISYKISRNDLYENSVFDDDSSTKNTLSIGLIGKCRNTTIENVNFTNYIITLSTGKLDSLKNLVITPFAYSFTNCNISNVNISNGKIVLKSFVLNGESLKVDDLKNSAKDNIKIVNDKLYAITDKNTVISSSSNSGLIIEE